MLLVRLYINGSWRYISDRDQMAHVSGTTYRQYVAGLIAMDEIRFATSNPWGGRVAIEYGTMTISPDVFAGDWPPPGKADVRVCYGDAGESDEQMLLMGSAYLLETRADGIVYALYAPLTTTMVTDETFFGGLLNVFSYYCADLGLTLDTGCYDDLGTYWAGGPNPTVEYMASGDRALINALADLAAWTCYRFWVEGTTLRLVHHEYSSEPPMSLDSSEIMATSYPASQPFSRYECEGEQVRPTRWRLMFEQLQNPMRTAVAFAELRVKWVYEGQWHFPGDLACADATPLYPLSNMWDNNAATYWAADFPIGDTGDPQYLIFTSSGYYIDSYRLQARNDSFLDQAAISWQLDAWDTATSRWRKVQDVTAQQWTAGSTQEFPAPVCTWNAAIAGGYAYGDVCSVSPSCNWYHTDKVARLTEIKSITEMPRARVQLPLAAGRIPAIGQLVTYTDDTMRVSTDVAMRVASITYNFETSTCVIEGEATLT
ncbi:MAG: hypothetical protein RBR02_11205 [Desulfuromonadaceae bacterium]|nr:hypothetical protein [Desulfuromonadaceae bacterium]